MSASQQRVCIHRLAMTSFWGNSVAPGKPLVVELDPCAELNITAATLQQGGKPGKAALLKICADGGDTFTLATLVPGAREHQRLDVQLGAGNEKVVFTVSGGAKVDLTGYRTVPEEYGMIDDDDDDDDDDEEEEEDDDDDEVETVVASGFVLAGLGYWIGGISALGGCSIFIRRAILTKGRSIKDICHGKSKKDDLPMFDANK